METICVLTVTLVVMSMMVELLLGRMVREMTWELLNAKVAGRSGLSGNRFMLSRLTSLLFWVTRRKRFLIAGAVRPTRWRAI